MFENCNFEERLKLCLKKNATIMTLDKTSQQFNSFQDIKYFVYEIKFFVLTILLPIVSITGIILNLLVIIVFIRQNKNHIFRDNIFKYMTAISFFNLTILVLSILRLMSECITYNSLFCSVIRENLIVQSFFITEVFLKSFFKMSATLTLLAFSLCKNHSIFENENSLIKTKHSSRKIFALIFSTSFLFSFEQILQYKLNEFDWNLVNKFPIEKDMFLDFVNPTEGLIYTVIILIGEFINSFFFVILILIIDIVLIHKFNKLKKDFFKLFNKTQSKYLKRLKTKEINFIKMIILTGCLNFIFRLPELVGTTLKYLKFFFAYNSVKYKIKDPIHVIVDLCINMEVCDDLKFITEIFYLTSCSIDFFLFYYFNKPFRNSFKKFFKRR